MTEQQHRDSERWATALRRASAWRQRRVRQALAIGGPRDGLAREAAAYGIVPDGTSAPACHHDLPRVPTVDAWR